MAKIEKLISFSKIVPVLVHSKDMGIGIFAAGVTKR
jgi:hypothetical protein